MATVADGQAAVTSDFPAGRSPSHKQAALHPRKGGWGAHLGGVAVDHCEVEQARAGVVQVEGRPVLSGEALAGLALLAAVQAC